jgi:hypothetical protein
VSIINHKPSHQIFSVSAAERNSSIGGHGRRVAKSDRYCFVTCLMETTDKPNTKEESIESDLSGFAGLLARRL